MLFAVLIAVTSMGWIHAADVQPVIFSDLGTAVTNKPIVFNVGTAKGTMNATNVRVKISLTTNNNSAELSSMGLKYFQDGKWNTWNAENGEYLFGPQAGFSLSDLVSPILMTPTTAGTYSCQLDIVDLKQSNKVLATRTFQVVVGDGQDLITKSDTVYSTPNAYAQSHDGHYAGLLLETKALTGANAGKYSTLVYAGGLPVTVSASGANTKIKITAADESEAMVLDPTKTFVSLYGGMKEADVNSSTIVMTGGTLSNLIGGGRGSDGKSAPYTYADVEGATSITISGGTVGYLIPGGYECARSEDVTVTITGTDTKIGDALCGGYAPVGMAGQSINTLYDESANRVASTTFNMTGGTISGYMFVGGGYSYSYLKEVNATFDGVTMNKGILGNGSNGRSDKVVATLTGCTFKKAGGQTDVIEIAAINRGIVKDVTMNFNGCIFPSATADYYCYLGATYRWGYNYNGSTSKVEGIPGSVKFSFDSSCQNVPVVGISDGLTAADVTLIGAKAKLEKFEYTKDQYHKEFAIDKGKTWTFDNDKPLSIGEGITLNGEGTINGHIALAGENVTLKGLTINATSIGTNGPQKTVILGACDKVTIQDCKLNGIVPAADKNKYVANGIDLTTKSESASYTITGNTITGCNGLVDNWTAINVIVQDAKSSKIDNSAIALENTYDDRSFGYVRMTANDAWSYAYVKGADNYKAANAFYCMKTNGGAIDAPDATCDDILKELNGEPFAIAGTVSATCKDGYITTNSADASKMLAEGKAVKLLTYNADGAEGAKFAFSEINVAPLITNLPDSVAFASTPIKLAFNTNNVEVTATTGSELVSLTDGVLSFLNPGEVELTLKVKKDSNSDGKIDSNDSGYEEGLTNTQKLKITKRTLTLTAGIVPNYAGKQGDTAIVYDAKTDVTLKWNDDIAVSGLPWEAAASGYFKTDLPTGNRANKNVGDKVPVEITNEDLNALLNADSVGRYTLAPITFVTAKVVKAKATVKANDVSDHTFGLDLPPFEATTMGLESGDQLDGTLKFICSATPNSVVKEGGYDIMPYGLTSDNYAITFEKGTLTVKATNPKIEIVDAKVTGNAEAKTITVQAKLVHAGGLETATVTAKDVESEVAPASEVAITPDANGIYKFEVSNAAAKKHTITFTATTTESSNNTGTASIDVMVEKGTPQNLKFDDKVLSSIVYGDSLALIVSSDQAAAKGDYTFKATVKNEEAKIISATNVLKPTAVGDVVVTVSRAADDTYSSATITKIIKVTTRPLKAVVAAFEPKKYDGDAKVKTMPAITLSSDYKVIGKDVVTIASGATATYASKNVGTHAISLSTLTLDGAQAGNYTLIQPTNLKGEIKRADATVKVDDVTRMYNQRYTKYSFSAESLVDGESLSSVYTGKLDVTENEKEGTLTLKIDGGLCRNYNLSPVNGKLTVTKGTPVVVAYKVNEEAKALVVDSAGHQNLTVSGTPVNGGYFQVTGDDGSVTNSVNAISTLPNVINALSVTKAGDDWAGWNSEEATTIEYTGTSTITNVNNYTYSSTDLNRLSIDGTTLTANGVGKVAIIATSTSGDVKVKLYDVTPKAVTYTADMSKTYDGLTLATGSVTLTGVHGNDNAVLDMEGVTFNYASPAAGGKTINPSQAPILTGADANNYNLVSAVTGEIAKKAITVSEPISAYYTGQTKIALDEFTSEGILSNDIVSLNVTLDKAEVGPRKFTLQSLAGDNAANYDLSTTGALDGTILKPTIVVTVPETASSTTDAKNKLTYTIRETGKPVSDPVFSDAVQVVSLGNDAYQVSTKKENSNFSLIYTKNLIGFKSEPTPPSGGGDGDETVTISLDATTKTLPRLEEFVLKATVSNGKTVTWSSSDPTIASVTADGNKATVKGLKVGTATITAKIGDVTATCEVTVDFATGLEEAIANTAVYGKDGYIHIQPVAPMQAWVVNIAGTVVYHATISSATQIPVSTGIYLVKLGTGSESVVTKVSVR